LTSVSFSWLSSHPVTFGHQKRSCVTIARHKEWGRVDDHRRPQADSIVTAVRSYLSRSACESYDENKHRKQENAVHIPSKVRFCGRPPDTIASIPASRRIRPQVPLFQEHP